jgi:LCP family protein required for cell wall assembly
MRVKWLGRRTPSGGGSAQEAAPAGPKRRRSLAFVITAWVSGVMAAVLVAAALVAYFENRAIWGSIRHEAVTGLGKRPPKYATSAMNILAFGSDTRAGLTRREQLVLHVGRTGCGCSDTIMVVHISPGRHHVTVLNIPRDLMVPMYGCVAADGKPGEQEDTSAVVQINQTLALGGPSCLWKTVEHLTGIHIDHFVQLEFDGVVKVVNDVGGVNVCVPYNISDPSSGLHIKAGVHHIFGLRFLEFWRARETVADGSDLKRIQRDDLLLAEILRGVVHKGLLQSPTRLLPIVQDAAHAIYATDAGMSELDMFHIAESFRGLTTKDVQFIEAPTQVYPPQPAQVELVQPRDSRLFSAIAHDVKLPSKTSTPQPGTSGQPVLDMVAPPDVHVTVLNGTSPAAPLASNTAASLTARGFTVVGAPANASTSNYTSSVIEYSSAADLPAARTLATQLTHVRLRQVAGITPGTVTLILGSTFTTLAAHSPAAGSSSSSPSPSSSSSKSPSVGSLANTYGGITGTANCKRDKRAFEP